MRINKLQGGVLEQQFFLAGPERTVFSKHSIWGVNECISNGQLRVLFDRFFAPITPQGSAAGTAEETYLSIFSRP